MPKVKNNSARKQASSYFNRMGGTIYKEASTQVSERINRQRQYKEEVKREPTKIYGSLDVKGNINIPVPDGLTEKRVYDIAGLLQQEVFNVAKLYDNKYRKEPLMVVVTEGEPTTLDEGFYYNKIDPSFIRYVTANSTFTVMLK